LADVVSGSALVISSSGAAGRGITSRVGQLIPVGEKFDAVTSNPTVRSVDAAIQTLRSRRFDAVVAIGGGSVIDVAKVLSLSLAAPDLDLTRLVEGAGDWNAVDPLPLTAIPTTAGTGSEVTATATLWDDETRRKVSVSTPRLFARTAIIDPELTMSLPWDVTLSTGLDAYSQCFEAIVNRRATPVTTALATRGLSLVPDALRAIRDVPDAADARASMAEAALMSGVAISQTRTALAHSISYPLTAHLGVPHGLACAFALPAVLDFHTGSDDGSLATVAARLGMASADDLVAAVLGLYEELGVADALRRYIGDGSAIGQLVPDMLTPGRSDNSLRPATQADVQRLVEWSVDHLVAGAQR
jgi:alcohol dehydrogenase